MSLYLFWFALCFVKIKDRKIKMHKQLQCVECSEMIDVQDFAWGHECDLVDNY